MTQPPSRIRAHDRPTAVEVRPSAIDGLGVFARRTLPGRRKIGHVTGVLVRLPAARRAVEGRRKIYLVELTARVALDCSRGNAFRHLNHSCAPNCYLRVHRRVVEVYTLRRIPRGAELTLDYVQTPHRGGMRCTCGRGSCRARL